MSLRAFAQFLFQTITTLPILYGKSSKKQWTVCEKRTHLRLNDGIYNSVLQNSRALWPWILEICLFYVFYIHFHLTNAHGACIILPIRKSEPKSSGFRFFQLVKEDNLMKKLLSLVLVLMLALSCVFTASATELTEYRTYITTTGEMETWCIQKSQNAADLNYLSNCLDGLLTNDNHGNLKPNIAYEWYVTDLDDGTTSWTFKLNEGVQWVNASGEVMAETIAEDWLWGMEWILNYYKNGASNTSMLTSTVKGAEDYYNYTRGYTEESSEEDIANFEAICDRYGLDKTPLTEEEGKALGLEVFSQIVSASAPDNYTLVIELSGAYPYFPTLTCYNCLYPISGKLLESIGVDGYYNVSPETLWYNGPYTCTMFIHGNEKIFTANPNYWNKENVTVFDSVTVKCVESTDVAFQYFQTGEIDVITLSQSNLLSIYNNESNEFHDYIVEAPRSKYSWSMRFNYNKNLEDGVTPDTNWNTAVANENFRLAILYGLEPTSFLARQNAINPLKCQNFCYTAEGVSITSDGRDYTTLVLEELGYDYDYTTYVRYQPELAADYKAKAIEELTAAGVTLPVSLDYYISGSNQTSMDTALVMKQMFADCLGEDLVVFNICTYISSSTQEVRNPRKHSISISGWMADYGDPLNFLDQEIYGDSKAYYAVYWENINDITDPTLIATYEEFNALVEAANAIVDDADARLAAFAKAEAYMINHGLTIPMYVPINWEITSVNDYSKISSAYGIQTARWVNWETKLELYTTEEYEQFLEAYNAE